MILQEFSKHNSPRKDVKKLDLIEFIWHPAVLPAMMNAIPARWVIIIFLNL